MKATFPGGYNLLAAGMSAERLRIVIQDKKVVHIETIKTGALAT